ncbi:MAG: hypothetical protein U9Q37_10770 [Euryarchaeota archaeon]|nr:hypothetical protein [Euryarchaeota archaeon]
MNFGIKGSAEGLFVKKLFLTCILILGIILIAGCIGEEKTNPETPASHQITQESDTQTTNSILKLSDVPGLTLNPDSEFWAVPKNTLCVVPKIPLNIAGNETNRKRYKDTLPIGYRNVGENSLWTDQSGRSVRIFLSKYDSDPNSKLIESFTDLKDTFEEEYVAKREHEPNTDYDWGDPHIGDYSVWGAQTDTNTDIQITQISFVYNNNWVNVFV